MLVKGQRLVERQRNKLAAAQRGKGRQRNAQAYRMLDGVLEPGLGGEQTAADRQGQAQQIADSAGAHQFVRQGASDGKVQSLLLPRVPIILTLALQRLQ